MDLRRDEGARRVRVHAFVIVTRVTILDVLTSSPVGKLLSVRGPGRLSIWSTWKCLPGQLCPD